MSSMTSTANDPKRPRSPTDQDSSETLREMLANIDVSLDNARRKLADAQHDYGEKALTFDATTINRAKKDVDALMASETAMVAARGALERRIALAVLREEEEAWDAQWEICDAALNERALAFDNLEIAWHQFEKAYKTAARAATKAEDANPLRRRSLVTFTGRHVFERFEDLHGLGGAEILEIAKALDGRDPLARFRQTMVERGRKDAEHLRSLRERKPPAKELVPERKVTFVT